MIKRLIHYLVEDLNIQSNVAVTIILSLFTFSLGFIITWSVAGISKIIRRKNYKRSLKVVITNFISSCEAQYFLLENLTTKGFLHGENYNVLIKSNFGQHYLASLDIKTFIDNFSSFLKRNRPQEICELFNVVETVKEAKNFFKEQMKTHYSNFYKHLDNYDENIDQLRKIQGDLILDYHEKNGQGPSSDYGKSIIYIFKAWRENGEKININDTYSEIVIPIFEKTMQVVPSDVSRRIMENCLACRNAIQNIQNIEEDIRDEINLLKSFHKEAYIKGTEILKKW